MKRKSLFKKLLNQYYNSGNTKKRRSSNTSAKQTVVWPGHSHSRRKLSSRIGDYDLLTAMFVENYMNIKNNI